MKKIVFLLFFCVSLSYAQEEAVKVESIKMNPKGESILIENITVIDVISGKQEVTSVLIRDKKIEAIQKKISVIDATVIKIDGTGKWLMPGMIDSHIHLFQSGSLYTRPDALNLTQYHPYEDERKWLRQNAPDLLKRYLQAGITTVIDVGGPLYNYRIRDRYSDNTSFPNIYLTGPLISTYQPKAFEIEDSPIIKANTPEEAVELVKQQLPFKPDFIKIWYIASADIEKNYKIVKATIDESHKHNLKVAVHATQLETAKRALTANADILVHSVDNLIDQEFIDLVLAKDVVYIPTLMVSNKYTDAYAQEMKFTTAELKHSNPYAIRSFSDYKHLNNPELFNTIKRYTPGMKKRDEQEDRIQAENLKLLQKNNVTIATGTDAGNIGTLHATSYQEEIRLMHEAGLSNLEIIQASTINAAKTLDKENELGSVETTKLADLLILDANPLKDINALQNISHVIKGGSIYSIENVLKESPKNIVQKQVNAYNAGNLEAFLDTYSDGIEIYNFPDQLVLKGKESLKKDFDNYFEKNPNLHCHIVDRIVQGNKVIDHERITYGKDGLSEVIAIYIIENHKIAKVYFVRD